MKIKALGFIVTLALLAVPVLSLGQQSAKVYRIGFLGTRPLTAPGTTRLWEAFVEGLRERGYIEGQNLLIERRWTEGQGERAPALAAELLRLQVDLLVAAGTVQVWAAKQATSETPILMVGVIDPVGRGLVASLAHPGGNVTGLADMVRMATEGKRLELLKEAVPTLSRVAVLDHPRETPVPDVFQREREGAARALGLTLQHYRVRDPEEFAGAFAAMTTAQAEALFVVPARFWMDYVERIVELAVQSRLPALYPARSYAEAGGFMSYGYDQPAAFRRLGLYVDKIFKGANPGDLPVEQPTKFELVINLKTAKALGLTIPQSLLNRADEVIQ